MHGMSLWQGIQAITDHKGPPQVCDSNPSLPDQLNDFYARFEESNDTPALRVPLQPGEQVLRLTPSSVKRVLSHINSPLLFTLLAHDCSARSSTKHIIQFADDTTVVGLIKNDDEGSYREEVRQLEMWCCTNNLKLFFVTI